MARQTVLAVKGMSQALKALRELKPLGMLAMGQLLVNFGNTLIVAPAKKITPVVTGNLRSTIMTGEPSFTDVRVKVIVSAGGPAAKYAVKVHENPRSGITGGWGPYGATRADGSASRRRYKRYSRVGQWKFLETPAKEAAKNSAWIAKESRIILSRLRRLEKT